MDPTLDRFRTALKFSLWAWALYWPGGGLILLQGGLDPLSLTITAACILAFLLLVAGGALRTTSSRNLWQLFLERPLYLVAGIAVFAAGASLLPALENWGLMLYSAVWASGIGIVAWRWHQHLVAADIPVWSSKADQVYVVLGLVGIGAGAVFLDAFLPLFARGQTLGTSSAFVAVCSWVNLLYPPLVLLATRPFREPLSFRRVNKAQVAEHVPMAVEG